MISLENEFLTATIDPKGAELQTLCRKDNGLNYLWKGDPAFWGKHSPILFPIVGALKENTYYYEGKKYTLPRHGFARDRQFDVAGSGPDEAWLLLRDDAETRSVYPFPFVLSVRYHLDGPVLAVRYEVRNPGQDPLYFSIGGHPAFSVPLVEGTKYEDYYLLFSQAETKGRHVLEDGLLRAEVMPFLEDQQKIALTHELFAADALVFQGLHSDTVLLGSDKTPHGLRFVIGGWPDLGIWAAPGAPFVCIEPWQGHADFVHSDQQLVHKEGIVRLDAEEKWERGWAVELF
jgi:galactose mutarotase-like enzyme